MRPQPNVLPPQPPLSIVSCKDCGREQSLLREQLPQRGQALEIQCDCGNIYQLACDNRRFLRKSVELSGTLSPVRPSQSDEQEDITLIDISLGGIRFRTAQPNIETGDRFRVRFLLDPIPRTWFEQEIIVRHVQDTTIIGAEFVDQTYNPDLDLYLMSFQVSD